MWVGGVIGYQVRHTHPPPGHQISYAIPIVLAVTTGKEEFKAHRSPAFSLGPASSAMHWIAGVWLVLTSCIFFWPSSFPVHVVGVSYDGGPPTTFAEDNMNWTVVVVGAVFILFGSWYAAVARHVYKGPRSHREQFLSRRELPSEVPHREAITLTLPATLDAGSAA